MNNKEIDPKERESLLVIFDKMGGCTNKKVREFLETYSMDELLLCIKKWLVDN